MTRPNTADMNQELKDAFGILKDETLDTNGEVVYWLSYAEMLEWFDANTVGALIGRNLLEERSVRQTMVFAAKNITI